MNNNLFPLHFSHTTKGLINLHYCAINLLEHDSAAVPLNALGNAGTRFFCPCTASFCDPVSLSLDCNVHPT